MPDHFKIAMNAGIASNLVPYLENLIFGINQMNKNIKEMAKEIDSLLSSKSLFNKYSSASKENANNYLIKNVKPMWDNIIK